MSTRADPEPPDIADLHRCWDVVHRQLRQTEQVLSEAIELYARGQGGRPEALMQQVEQMRAECAKRFRAMMNALRG